MASDGRRSLCVGTGLVVLDVVYNGEGPAAGPSFFAGGSRCNVLTILSYLGWEAMPAAVVGGDPEGRWLVRDIERWGVRTDLVMTVADAQTPRIIERVRSGARPRHRFEMTCDHGKRLPRRRAYPVGRAREVAGMLPAAGVFYFDRASAASREILRGLKPRGSLIVFEPHRLSGNGIFLECLEAADIVKYSEDSAPGAGRIAPGAAIEVRTRGDRGLEYWLGREGRRKGGGAARHGRLEALPAARVADEAGSGDWLTAGMLYALLRGGGSRRSFASRRVDSAIRFGQALASLNCGFVGARGIMYAAPRSRVVGAAVRMAERAPRTSCGAPAGSAASAQNGLQGMRGMAGMAGAHAHRQRRMSPQCRACACG